MFHLPFLATLIRKCINEVLEIITIELCIIRSLFISVCLTAMSILVFQNWTSPEIAVPNPVESLNRLSVELSLVGPISGELFSRRIRVLLTVTKECNQWCEVLGQECRFTIVGNSRRRSALILFSSFKRARLCI